MRKKFNFKKMFKGMTLVDQANLLFADANLRSETADEEFVLTSGEKKTIVEECAKKKQLAELNRFNQYYNLLHKLLSDLRARTQELELMLSRLDTVVLGAYFREHSQDLFCKSSGDEKCDAHIVQGFKDIYSWFTPAEDPDEEDFEKYIECFRTREPNHYIQHSFANAVMACRRLKQVLFMIDWFEERSQGVKYFSELDMTYVHAAEDAIKAFEQEQGFLGAIRMYRDAHEACLIKKSGLEVPVFELFLVTPEIALELTEEEKEEAEQVIQMAMRR